MFLAAEDGLVALLQQVGSGSRVCISGRAGKKCVGWRLGKRRGFLAAEDGVMALLQPVG